MSYSERVPWMIRVLGGTKVFYVDDPTGEMEEYIPPRHYEARPVYLEFRELDESSIETLTLHPIWVWMWRILTVLVAAVLTLIFFYIPIPTPKIAGAIDIARTAVLILDVPFVVLVWSYLQAARFANVFHVRRSGITMRKAVFRPWVPRDLSGEDITGVEYKPYWWAVLLRLNIGKLTIEAGTRTEKISFVGNAHDAYRLVDAVNKRGGTGGIIGPLMLLIQGAWMRGEAPPDWAIEAVLGPVTQKWTQQLTAPPDWPEPVA